ncbi:MAG: twin-arginine translocation signal domain-containing protein, partial [Thermodesulfobacteriota bacterium]
MMSNRKREKKTSRRSFLAGGAMLGAGVLLPGARASAAAQATGNAVLNSTRRDAPYELCKPENIIYTACLQCNTGCG